MAETDDWNDPEPGNDADLGTFIVGLFGAALAVYFAYQGAYGVSAVAYLGIVAVSAVRPLAMADRQRASR